MTGRKTARAGFTLFELLVVLAILGVVSTIGIGAFFNITGVWSKSRYRLELGDSAQAMLDLMREDLNRVASSTRTGHAVVGIDILNDDEAVKYEGMVRLEDDRLVLPLVQKDAEGRTRRLSVRYHVDREIPVRPVMTRTIGKLGDPEPKGASQVVADGANVLTFEVEYLSKGTWHPSWSESHNPEAIRVSLTIYDPVRTQEQVSRSAVFPIHVE